MRMAADDGVSLLNHTYETSFLRTISMVQEVTLSVGVQNCYCS